MANFPQGALDVGTAEQAAAAAKVLQSVPELAVDVEADSMHAFRARLCFVQVGTDEDVFLFDTLAPGVTLEGLKPLLQDPAKTKFFHAAGGDLQYLAEAGIRVRGLFDTHRAATLLGWPKVGLADLARERLSVTLLKEHQQSDFSLRPLPEGMRAYIADDVRYLSEIGRQVRAACEQADILEEVLLDCQRMCEDAAGRPEIAPFRPKIPRALPPAERAFQHGAAQALHAKRLLWAERANLPMGRLLSNAALTELLTRPPPNLDRMKRVPGIRGSFVRDHGEETLAILTELKGRAESGTLTNLAEETTRDPNCRKREEALKEFRSAKAVERRVTSSVVLPNSLIESLAKTPPVSLEELGRIPFLGEKRLKLYGRELVALLNSLQ